MCFDGLGGVADLLMAKLGVSVNGN